MSVEVYGVVVDGGISLVFYMFVVHVVVVGVVVVAVVVSLVVVVGCVV